MEVCEERRKLHNRLTDMKGAIRVIARARPPAVGPNADAEAASLLPAVQCNPLTSSIDVLQRFDPSLIHQGIVLLPPDNTWGNSSVP